MGIIKTLRRQGSELSKYDGKTPPDTKPEKLNRILRLQGSKLSRYDGSTPPNAVYPDPLMSSRSDLSAYKGKTPPLSLLTTNQSPLLYPYSITGENRDQVQFEYSLYTNSATSVIPLPTRLGVDIYATPLSYFYGGTEGYYAETGGVGPYPHKQTENDSIKNRLTIAYTAKIANQDLGSLANNPFGISTNMPPSLLLEYNSPISSPSDPSLEFVRIQNPTIKLKDLYLNGEDRTKAIYDNKAITSKLPDTKQDFISRKKPDYLYNPYFKNDPISSVPGVSWTYYKALENSSNPLAVFQLNGALTGFYPTQLLTSIDHTTIYNKPILSSKVSIDYISTDPSKLGYLMPKKSLGGIKVDNWDVPNIMSAGATQMYVELYKESGLSESLKTQLLETEPGSIVNRNSSTSPIPYPTYVDEEPGRKNKSTSLSSLNPVYTSLISSLANNLTPNESGGGESTPTLNLEPYPNIASFNRETTYETSVTVKERGFIRQSNRSFSEDEYNSTPVLQQNDPNEEKKKISNPVIEANTANTPDLIKFFFEINNNDSVDINQNWFLFFRAYINDLTDNFQANWDPYRYVGRGENFYKYNGFSREVNLTFTVYAHSRKEMIPIYEKLNYLVGTLAPDYSQIGFMRGNFVNLTIGDYFVNTPSIIKSITLNPSFEAGWDINRYAIHTSVENGKLTDRGSIEKVGNLLTPQDYNYTDGNYFVGQLPYMIEVTLNFTPIHSFTPQFKKNFVRNVPPPPTTSDVTVTPQLQSAKPIKPTTFSPPPPTLTEYRAIRPGFTRALNDLLNPTQPGSGVLAQPTIPFRSDVVPTVSSPNPDELIFIPPNSTDSSGNPVDWGLNDANRPR